MSLFILTYVENQSEVCLLSGNAKLCVWLKRTGSFCSVRIWLCVAVVLCDPCLQVESRLSLCVVRLGVALWNLTLIS